ncbi:mitochondrial isocitrate dehydrogenase, putative [Ichthyophthirius multifiliis]|uniref:Isocitrate dehydrogenase [NADP] n=1 Tax=Ichthyophthirius multifiliis TaxID=5932 RepID=G0R5D0_ICHMU|nr:mitochondrial isocitrate dehydrogenase, putative [Ichthyophthirius multifiliis]EGR27319.1 mitochondrial isocitrate dehydrogenase, putative [Ichthyophthirius multifiliis]|eukprot:XP_004024203.1 mitochondrial isocitrate dehydrogenase, putative [Ichthyophthirius multifiliis]
MNQIKKIKVENPIVELDSEQMSQSVWNIIKKRLIFPFLDVPIKYYDLSIAQRDKTNNKITTDAALSIVQHKVGIKCPSLGADIQMAREFERIKGWDCPNVTIGNILNGTLFAQPILIKNIKKVIPNWKNPIIVARQVFQDFISFDEKQVQNLELKFTNEKSLKIQDFSSTKGSILGFIMYNTEEYMIQFAKDCFEYALEIKFPLYFSTRADLYAEYDEKLVQIFQNMYQQTYKTLFFKKNIIYEHKNNQDMLIFALKSQGGFVWACKRYDGEIHSQLVSQGFGNSGLTTNLLFAQQEKALYVVSSYFRQQFQQGKEIYTNAIACIFVWIQGLLYRGKLDGNQQLISFCQLLQKSVILCSENEAFGKELIEEKEKFEVLEKLIESVQKNMINNLYPKAKL